MKILLLKVKILLLKVEISGIFRKIFVHFAAVEKFTVKNVAFATFFPAKNFWTLISDLPGTPSSEAAGVKFLGPYKSKPDTPKPSFAGLGGAQILAGKNVAPPHFFPAKISGRL